jgi:hypothetical protein
MQCERCSEIFHGKRNDRAIAHTNEPHSVRKCPERPPPINEGVTEQQWAMIDNVKKPRTDTEKWNEIWRILFPFGDLPDHPC